ncbi:MAG TPA: flagellar hook-basal body complex protein FliE [Alphaproteobacteria bacterium]
MTTINPGFNALSAYNRAAGAGALGAGGTDPVNKAATLGNSVGAGQPSFGDLLTKATEKVIDTQKTGEKVSADAVLGRADLTDVIQAVNNAEMSLNMFLSVRDKLVEAYQRISQTQI